MSKSEPDPAFTEKVEHCDDHGPFDIVGDIHGCFDEATALLAKLGYEIAPYDVGEEAPLSARHPDGRRLVLVGDFCDRGPQNINALRLVMGLCASGTARAVVGNHDRKLQRWLDGRKVQVAYGLELTVAELETCSAAFRDSVRDFITELPPHLLLDDGQLVIAHAGLREDLQGVDSSEARSFALYGDTTGEKDDYGFPVRREWGRAYAGDATVVYGHTPMHTCEWINNTICIDTGCVFGGALTALRWPERELVSVDAQATYWEPTKPLGLRSDAPL